MAQGLSAKMRMANSAFHQSTKELKRPDIMSYINLKHEAQIAEWVAADARVCGSNPAWFKRYVLNNSIAIYGKK